MNEVVINIKILTENKLTPTEYFYLWFLANDEICPISLNVDVVKLEKKGFIKIGEDKLYVRQKTIELFKDKDYIYDDHEEKLKAVLESVDKWIDDWRKLFPSSKEIPNSGYPLQGDKRDCIKKMKAFLKTHFKDKKLKKDEIFDATKLYLSERKKENYQFTKMANYFINKDGLSILDMYINKLRELRNAGKFVDIDISNYEATASLNSMTDDI